MSADPLDQVLWLVAEGRLSPEDAAPILAALDERPANAAAPGASGAPGAPGAPGSRPTSPTPRPASSRSEPSTVAGHDTGPADAQGAGGAALRIEVIENGRPVVNLRLPVAIGRLALDRVPGLSGEQVERVRDALKNGLRGPVLEVEDGLNAVRIVLE